MSNHIQPNKTDILNKYAFYSRANDRFKKELEQAGATVRLKQGEFYFFEGEVSKQIGLVGEGSIRVYKQSESGREITLYHVTPGESCILTASCILAGIPYPASSVAETDTQAIVYPSGIFRKWIEESTEIRQFVFEMLATRMTSVMSLLEEVMFNRMDFRLAQYLKQKFKNTEGPNIEITHEQIASDLGTAREVVSRLLKDLERRGAITLMRGRIAIINDKILKK